MSFKTFLPAKHLQPYVRCYWLIDDTYDLVSDVSFPDGFIEIIFSVNLDVMRKEQGKAFQKNHMAELLGQMTQPYKITVNGRGRVFGIRFHPHTFSLFSPDKVSLINDQSIDLKDVFGSAVVEFGEECLALNHTDRLIRYFDDLFWKKLTRGVRAQHRTELAGKFVHEIVKSHGHARLEPIAKESKLSLRYIQQLFLDCVGVSPKTFARTVRFRHSLTQLNSQLVSLTENGLASGYYDQAHFIREFKSFTGLTPRQYRSLNHPVNQHFLGEELS